MQKMSRELSAQELSKYSRFLTRVLRHQAKDFGLELEGDGGVALAELVRLPRLSSGKLADPAEVIRQLVQSDAKGRFALYEKNGREYVRATQGHSIALAAPVLERVTDANGSELGLGLGVAVHGTFLSKWAAIAQSGLCRMQRQHIHFAPVEANEFKSGIRANAQVLVYVDVRRAMADGIEFFVSANKVILSPGDANGYIKPEYFKQVKFLADK